MKTILAILAMFGLLISPTLAAVIDEADRRTEAEWAQENGLSVQEVHKAFEATGQLRCGDGGEGSAQVTVSGDVITTAAHMFYSSKNCKKLANPKTCRFIINGQVYKVASLKALGFNCPQPTHSYNDWAVLKLDRPVIGVNPYKIPGGQGATIPNGQNVVAVTVGAADFYVTKNGKRVFPKAIGICEVKDNWSDGSGQILFASNCDSTPGSSGGSTLVASGDGDGLVLVGIISRGEETQDMVKDGGVVPNPNKGPYLKGKWSTYHVPLKGRFAQAVLDASN